MPRREQIIPPIDVFPSPEDQTVNYQFVYELGYVHDSGSTSSSHEKVVERPNLDSMPTEELEKVNPETTTLAWVQFYQRAVVTVRHPERFAGDVPGPWSVFEGRPVATETLNGDRFPAAEPQLLIEAHGEELKFATIPEILEHGELTPFMRKWLSRYSQDTKYYGFNDFLLGLLPILDEDQRRDLIENKFRYKGIEQTG